MIQQFSIPRADALAGFVTVCFSRARPGENHSKKNRAVAGIRDPDRTLPGARQIIGRRGVNCRARCWRCSSFSESASTRIQALQRCNLVQMGRPQSGKVFTPAIPRHRQVACRGNGTK